MESKDFNDELRDDGLAAGPISRTDALDAHTPLAFGPFVLDPRERSLVRSGRPCKIQPQPLRILALLASRPERLITREELRREIWGEDLAVDYEHGLNFAINQIRTVLGDSAKNPRFVETVPKAGYRFIADVEPIRPSQPTESPPERAEPAAASGLGADGRSKPATAERPPSEPSRSRSLWSLTVLAVSVLAVTVLAVIGLWRLAPNDVPGPSAPSNLTGPATPTLRVAVLPFESNEVEPSHNGPALAKGVTFDLIVTLGRWAPDDLEVIGYRSIHQFLETQPPISDIGERLDVDFIVEGQISGHGDVVQIKAILSDVEDETVRWSTTESLAPADLVSVQQKIAGEIARTLVPSEASPSKGGGPGPTPLPIDPELYALFAESRWNFSVGAVPTQQAIAGLAEVTRRAPDFAPGYATLAASLAIDSFGSEQQRLPAAFQAAERALALDPSSAEALFALGILRAYAERDLAGGRDLIARALELEPGNANILAIQAGLETVLGNIETGALMTDLVVKLDPLAGNAWLDAGHTDYLAKRFERGRDRCARSLSLGTNSRFWAANCLLSASEAIGDLDGMDAAINYFLTDGLVTKPEWPEQATVQDKVRILRRQVIADLQGRNSHMVLDFMIATQTAALGLKEETLKHLEASFRRQDMLLPFAAVDPVFDGLAEEPRYRQIVFDLGLTPMWGQSEPQQ